MTDLSHRIRIAAERIGGLKQLSDQLPVPRRTLGNWLSGRSPKPEALRKIASLTDVSLDWLLTGEGEADEDGIAVLLRRAERQRVVDETAAKEFSEGLAKGLARIEARRLAGDHQELASTIEVRRRVMRAVRQSYRSVGVTAAGDDIALVSMEVFAALSSRVRNIHDTSEVEKALAHILHNLRQDLLKSHESPGTGKRSA